MSQALDNRSGSALDPFEPAFYADMHARLREARQQGPVLRIEALGTWCTTTYAGSKSVLGDPRLGKRGLRLMLTERFGAGSHIGDFLFFKDPPEQERLRRIVSQVWRPRLMATLAATARHVCAERLAVFKAAGGGDLVAEFAWRIPIPVIGSLFGLPKSDSAMIEEWGRDLFLATDMTRPDRLPSGRLALHDMYAYFAGHLAAVRAREPEAFLARLAAASHEGDRLSEHELVVMAMQLVIGGYDTTANQIANGAYLLLSNPGQLRALQADWSLLPAAVEEVLRCEPSAPFIGRQALADISAGTTVIAAGDFVGPLLAAANRDPARYADPDAFDIQAARPPHLSFGTGIHRCLGARLARVNLSSALTALFSDGSGQPVPETLAPQWRPDRPGRPGRGQQPAPRQPGRQLPRRQPGHQRPPAGHLLMQRPQHRQRITGRARRPPRPLNRPFVPVQRGG